MFPWTDYNDLSYCDLYDNTGTYITYVLACNYVSAYPSHWSWQVYQRFYDWAGTVTEEERQAGREIDRRDAKRASELWFKTNVGEISGG